MVKDVRGFKLASMLLVSVNHLSERKLITLQNILKLLDPRGVIVQPSFGDNSKLQMFCLRYADVTKVA